MARSKSIPGSKSGRTSKNPIKDQTVTENQVDTTAQNAVLNEATTAENTPAAKAAPEVTGAPESRKLEVVKSESRKNLVPINLEDEIRRRAFELYQERGSGPGNEAEDWVTAEREVRQRYRQQSA